MAKKKSYLKELSSCFFKSFNLAPVLLWEDKAFKIFTYIGGKADYYHPSVAELANNLKLARSTVGRKLKWLEHYNVLTVHRPSGNRVRFTINPISQWKIERLIVDGNIERRALVHGDYFEEGTDLRTLREIVLTGLSVDEGASRKDSDCSVTSHNKRDKDSNNILSSKDNKESEESCDQEKNILVNQYKNSPSKEDRLEERPHANVEGIKSEKVSSREYFEKRKSRISELLSQGLTENEAEDMVDKELPIENWMVNQ